MNYREKMVADLGGNLLGPRYGINEIFHEKLNPWKLYLTGVLAPMHEIEDEDGVDNNVGNKNENGEEDSSTMDVNDPIRYSPNLSSSSQPSSMGISFIVSTKDKCPKFDLCFSWARYIWNPNWDDLLKENSDSNGIFIGWNNPEKMKEKFYYKKSEKEQDPGIDLEFENINIIEEPSKPSHENSKNVPFGGWKRIPNYLIINNLEICPKRHNLNISGEDITNNNFEIGPNLISNNNFLITIRIKEFKKQNNRYFKIFIYFLNKSNSYNIKNLTNKERMKNRGKRINKYIFQPQIRVNCSENTSIEPFDMKDSKNPLNYNEDNNLKMLYHDLRPKSRGYMCSSTWREIDPERDPKNKNIKREQKGPPFNWLDGDLIEKNYPGIKSLFSPPDVRTEFVPIIPISAPDFNWRTFSKQNGKWKIKKINKEKTKFLDAEFLAENSWDPEILKKILNEIVEEYDNWIRWKEEKINLEFSIGSKMHWAINIANKNIEKHKIIIERIKNGIDVLYNNPNARLAFCFANKAISLQYLWKKKYNQGKIRNTTQFEPFYWRPFQIAYIIMSLKGLIKKNDDDRNIVDIIWIPTGGGKTEAYLGLAAFIISYRRRLGMGELNSNRDSLENGVNLISRYTLRLLTIQQFRRATKLIMACEFLRIQNLNGKLQKTLIGWLPETINNKNDFQELIKISNLKESWLWGTTRFSIGLWVGGTLTPNRLKSFYNKKAKAWSYGALDALKVKVNLGYVRESVEVTKSIGDPAQVTRCPICDCFLSLPKQKGQYLPKKFNLFMLVKISNSNPTKLEDELTTGQSYNTTFPFSVKFTVTRSNNNIPDFYTIGIDVECEGNAESETIEQWWTVIIENVEGLKPLSPDIRNSGYFYIFEDNSNIQYERITNDDKYKGIDFEIRCCNPQCELTKYQWAEKVHLSENEVWTDVQIPWRLNLSDVQISKGIPISAYTVDEQVYTRLPTMLIGTVDKFAQISFKDESGALFGNVDLYHRKFGYFRQKAIVDNIKEKINSESIVIKKILDPPEVILQDELHLIEGVLGSMVGIYETVIEELCIRYDKNKNKICKPKYIASSATIRASKEQVKSLFIRESLIFPASGISQKDNFFTVSQNLHPLNEENSGRLYIGVCCPGKSSQKPLTHIWSQLFQTPLELKRQIENDQTLTDMQKNQKFSDLDRFWTIVGYFNAIRELAGTRAIYSQEFITWMILLYGSKDNLGNLNYRNIIGRIDEPIELSSRTDSVMLPNYFEKLEKPLRLREENPVDGLLTTSMFGTGVDVSRLGVMIVTGQPKTNASYIQATGRIGRENGGIIISFLNARRPRDLDHYEQFSGYHRSLYKHVEPMTVSPFAPQCVKATIGPLLVALLRQAHSIRNVTISESWRNNKNGPKHIIASSRLPIGEGNLDYDEFIQIILERLSNQPTSRNFNIASPLKELNDNYCNWYDIVNSDLIIHYKEFTMNNPPRFSVVLGDPAHTIASLKDPKIRIVFNNTPNSLRGVESTTTFGYFINH